MAAANERVCGSTRVPHWSIRSCDNVALVSDSDKNHWRPGRSRSGRTWMRARTSRGPAMRTTRPVVERLYEYALAKLNTTLRSNDPLRDALLCLRYLDTVVDRLTGITSDASTRLKDLRVLYHDSVAEMGFMDPNPAAPEKLNEGRGDTWNSRLKYWQILRDIVAEMFMESEGGPKVEDQGRVAHDGE
ncbi:hypothetical protein E4U58_007054 [Claviceps cyperi]|nr:hypothetical protein E4U58_007054 [Claviceps cyperi]